MSKSGAEACAACSTSDSSTLTPTLMFGANTIGNLVARAAASSRLSAHRRSPVVPTTAPTPCRAHAARCASVPSGRVKSIRTSASRSAASTSVTDQMPVVRPKRSPASRPDGGLPATSSAAASVRSPGARAWPRSAPGPSGRPRPRSAMRTLGAVNFLKSRMIQPKKPRSSARVFARQRLVAAARFELGDRGRHFVAFPARELVVDEIDREIAMLERPRPVALNSYT